MIKLLKWGWRLTFVAIFTLSLAVNVAGFLGAALWKSASAVWDATTGMQNPVIAQADAAESLTKERDRLKKTNADLNAEKRLAKSKSKAAARKVSITTARMSRRLKVSGVRNVASMPAEAFPYIGAGVVVGVTALELNDLCETLKDMEDLRSTFNPDDALSEDRKTVCTIKVPTKDEVMTTVANAPEASWNAAKGFVTDLPEVDFGATWASTIEGVSELGDQIQEGAGDAVDATTEALSNGWKKAQDAATGLFSE